MRLLQGIAVTRIKMEVWKHREQLQFVLRAQSVWCHCAPAELWKKLRQSTYRESSWSGGEEANIQQAS